ncbi:putative AAA-ATPase [Clostridium acetireducens DSM 10703]|uniref:Putative AAA-ATPase n=1 Tax=Clostridium acetireducens DSM 10703 TaxID=1121290 RepID=A0A1E8F0Y1_9CLOT|nr:AAA family ATPase [Clostridium acetireducens]OFI07072.1 putative AAA-ATPase [Clostridium acetireducens DSM 10703]
MIKKIPVGISDFKELIQDNYYFVDKTLFIKDIIEDGAKAILLPRPRRFGKTLNMSMLKYFFEKTQEDNSVLFQNLEICNYKDIMNYQGKYPVIYISFKDIKYSNWKDCREAIAFLISSIFEDFKYVIDEKSSEQEQYYYNKILSSNSSIVELEMSFKVLTELLYKKTGKKPIVLIDEYDVPIQEAYLKKYYDELIGFMRNFFSGALKDNIYLEKAVLTGILRVAKESIFSGLNNLIIYSILSPYYNQYFGFTEKELEILLNYYKINCDIENIKEWYNGYKFGELTIYNPWSVLNYIRERKMGFRAYWANTSSNDLIRDLLAKGNNAVKSELETLINGKKLVKAIDENIVMNEIEMSTENLWSFLLFSGYLKILNTEIIDGRVYCTLGIPNKEVKFIYEEIILKWFKENINNDEFLHMLTALTKGDIDTFDMIFADTVEKTLSYFDVSGESEKFYHAFVLGMLVALKDTHDVKSNRESGYGRYDVMIIPKDKQNLGIIIEFKKINKRRKETLEDGVEKALNQIEEKDYKQELLDLGIKNIIELGIAFEGKEVLVKSK